MEKDMTGHNSTLSDEQVRALGYHHKGRYEVALAAQKKAAAEFKNVCKVAKADGITTDDIKLLIQLDTPEGEAALKADLNRRIQIANWAGAEVGKQFTFDDIPDRSPLDDRAFEEGRICGYKGEACSGEPYTGEIGQAKIAGWHKGQEELMSALELTRAGMEQVEAERAADAAEGEDAGDAPNRKTSKRGRRKGSGKKANADGQHEPAETDPFPAAA